MNITNGINSSSHVHFAGALTAKTASFAGINAVTAEDIVNKLKSLGNVHVWLDECEMTGIAKARPEPGLHLHISPAILQRMVEDSDFRERQFDILRNNLEVFSDPRFLTGRGEADSLSLSVLMTSAFPESRWTFTLDPALKHEARYVGPSNGVSNATRDPNGNTVLGSNMTVSSNYSSSQGLFQQHATENHRALTNRLLRTDVTEMLSSNRETEGDSITKETYDENYYSSTKRYEENNYNLNQLLFQQYAGQYAAVGDLLMKQSEEYLLSE